MELTDPNYHLKLIEMCDCYLHTNYPVQLRPMVSASTDDVEEEATKYLALAILYALTEKAGKLSFKRKKENITITIKVDGDKISLPAPPRELFDQILALMKNILHLEGDKVSMPLSLGLKNGELEVQVKMEIQSDKESLKLKFPKL